MNDENNANKESLEKLEKQGFKQEEIVLSPKKSVKGTPSIKEILPKTEAEKKKYKAGFGILLIIFLVLYTSLLFSIQEEMKQRTLNSDFGKKKFQAKSNCFCRNARFIS